MAHWALKNEILKKLSWYTLHKKPVEKGGHTKFHSCIIHSKLYLFHKFGKNDHSFGLQTHVPPSGEETMMTKT